MSYGANYFDSYRRSTRFIDRILKGAKPEDLPVEQPTLIDFVINLRAAKVIGIAISESMLLRATRIIE